MPMLVCFGSTVPPLMLMCLICVTKLLIICVATPVFVHKISLCHPTKIQQSTNRATNQWTLLSPVNSTDRCRQWRWRWRCRQIVLPLFLQFHKMRVHCFDGLKIISMIELVVLRPHILYRISSFFRSYSNNNNNNAIE